MNNELTVLPGRDVSRQPDATTPRAATPFAQEYIEVLGGWRYGAVRDLTVQEFFLASARLGGHQNRRQDHRRGWLVLWRGWAKLPCVLCGYALARRKKWG